MLKRISRSAVMLAGIVVAYQVYALLAVPLLRQPLTGRMLGGIIVSYAGVLVLLSQGNFSRLPNLSWPGVALALGSTVLWARVGLKKPA